MLPPTHHLISKTRDRGSQAFILVASLETLPPDPRCIKADDHCLWKCSRADTWNWKQDLWLSSDLQLTLDGCIYSNKTKEGSMEWETRQMRNCMNLLSVWIHRLLVARIQIARGLVVFLLILVCLQQILHMLVFELLAALRMRQTENLNICNTIRLRLILSVLFQF